MEPRPAHQVTRIPSGVRHPSNLHLCVNCRKPRVHPVWIEPLAGGCARAELRCPDCETRVLDVFNAGETLVLEEIQLEGMRRIQRALDRFAETDMSAWVDRFCDGLSEGTLGPSDF